MRKVALLAAAALSIMMIGIPAAQAAPFTGKFGPTIQGGRADLNGDGIITSGDTWIDFYGFTDIIDGGLDCDNWGAVVNDGSDGNNSIDVGDDCVLVGVDGTANGQTIAVTNGSFVEADGAAIPNKFKLPTVFNAAFPADSVGRRCGLRVAGHRRGNRRQRQRAHRRERLHLQRGQRLGHPVEQLRAGSLRRQREGRRESERHDRNQRR